MSNPPLLAQQIGITTTNPNFQTIQSLKPSFFVSTILNFLLGASGVASFIFLLWGGLQWIMAGGDKDSLDKARKKITAALIGLAIVFSAYAIIFVIRVLFNVNLIEFNLRHINDTADHGGGGAGNPLCGSCGSGGCGYTGQIYEGSGGACFTCTAGGWVPYGGLCGPNTCGTCP